MELFPISLGLYMLLVRNATQFKEELRRTIVGWAMPHMGRLLSSTCPMPRLEFRSVKGGVALEFGSAGAGGLKVE